ncbi:hypothetical protein [Luteolibacter luteus]|uniref:Uncharacterized protein n=1 Tax=Luteolibacter luteus TaxID=2728835 RepID=A0A858RM81_9BACT|nr:hypothetical protein [Luteolibacter luteus]QJE97479.1 hypothetical protein HHL09_17370 [Luteolibacter luteus]
MLVVLNSTLAPGDLRGKIEEKALQLIVHDGLVEVEWRESDSGHMVISHHGYKAIVSGAESEEADLMKAHDTELLAYLEELGQVNA